MMKIVLRSIIVGSVFLLLAPQALSDVVIKLQNGSVVRVPVDPHEIESIIFEAGKKRTESSAQTSLPPEPASTVASVSLANTLQSVLPDLPIASTRQPIHVGPKQTLKVPSQAAKIAKDGDVILIEAGNYPGDVSVWSQNNLTIRGVGGRPHFDAAGNSAEGKAIWVIKGTKVLIDNIEFSGCRVPDLNGAGIRFEGGDLTIRSNYIHHNQMGLLTSNNPDSRILIENSEFSFNTVNYAETGSLGHNIYIGAAKSFTLRGSYVHHASIGHNVKTRAHLNYVMFNRIMDEGEGNSSYLIDLSGGGDAYIVGNLFHKSKTADNDSMIGYATEAGRDDASAKVFVVNNTAVSDMRSAVFVHNHGAAVADVVNNIFYGGQTLVDGPSRGNANLVVDDPKLVDMSQYDYRLAAGSKAIDAGVDPTTQEGLSLIPEFQYLHPASTQVRKLVGPIDVGAYEFVQ